MLTIKAEKQSLKKKEGKKKGDADQNERFCGLSYSQTPTDIY